MMPNRQDKSHGPTRLHPTTGDTTSPRSRRTRFESASYRPSSVFRELLNQSARVRKSTEAALVESLTPASDGQASPETSRRSSESRSSSVSPPDSSSWPCWRSRPMSGTVSIGTP